MPESPICLLPDCDKQSFSRGYCRAHYGLLRKRGEIEIKRRKPLQCSIDGRNRLAFARIMCERHYCQWRGLNKSDEPKQEAIAYLIEKIAAYSGDSCMEWEYFVNDQGYGKVTYNGRSIHAHRVACELLNGPPPSPKHQCAHSCNNRKCFAPPHLRWATNAENMQDKIGHGTSGKCEKSKRTHLTNEQAKYIRESKVTKIPRLDLAKQFGITLHVIDSIRKGKTWKDLK